MIFIPSKGGRSHVEIEESSWEDCEKGANVLLHCLLRSANEKERAQRGKKTGFIQGTRSMNIRPAAELDRAGIIDIYISAFADEEKDIVAKLAVDLLAESSPPVISLVAVEDDEIVAHAASSPVCIGNDKHEDGLRGYILAPVAVRPDCQKQRIGSSLIGAGGVAGCWS